MNTKNLKTFVDGKFVDRELTEREKYILETVETGFDHESEKVDVTLGDYYKHMSEFVVVDPIIGQRDPSDEIDDKSFNLGILKGSSARKTIQLSTLTHRLDGLIQEYDDADDVENKKFYDRRIKIVQQYIAEGKYWHLDDGQNRHNQYLSVFAPDSEIPIELEDDLFFSYNVIEQSTGKPRRVTENLKGNCMAKMPETLREFILMEETTLNITSSEDDLLLSEFFNDDNNGTRASKYARIQQLARSPFKSQLEQIVLDCEIPKNYDFNYQSVSVVDPKTGKLISSWTPAEFLRDRWCAGNKSNSLYGRGSLGWQNLLLNIITHAMGNDLNSDKAHIKRSGPLQGNVAFGTTGFDKSFPVLMDEWAKMFEEDKELIREFQLGVAIAIDDLCRFNGLTKNNKGINVLDFGKKFRVSLGVNMGFLLAKVRGNPDIYIKDWGKLLKQYTEYDEDLYERTEFPLWTSDDANRQNPRCSHEDVDTPKWKTKRSGKPELKNGKKVYEQQTSGFWWECQNQTTTDSLVNRKIRISEWFDKKLPVLVHDDIVGVIPPRSFTQSTLEKYWEKQDGKCGYSQKDIDPDLLTTEHVDINYDDYKEGLLHLIGESQQTLSLDNFMINV